MEKETDISANDNTTDRPEPCCSFCGKPAALVKHLVASEKANICDLCIQNARDAVTEKSGQSKFTYVVELLENYFEGIDTDRIFSIARSYPARMRVDLQRTLDQALSPIATKCIGIHQQYSREKLQFSELIAKSKYPSRIAPVKYEEVDIGEENPARCMTNALWIIDDESGLGKTVVLLSIRDDYCGNKELGIEISGSATERNSEFATNLFNQIEKGIQESSSYRGKILSLEKGHEYSGQANGITVHKLPPVTRNQVVLSENTLKQLDRTVIEFVKQRALLREKGLSTKRGALFYGPPGTGKTYTIRYLAAQLPEHTTLLITAEQIGLLEEYMALARLLQLSIVVIEDADLIAKRRESMDSVCEEVFLDKLLNEMDGLKEEAEILFILTTNRPHSLEEALAGRPGRIDQAIEFPNPDAQCREKLFKLYGSQLKLGDALLSNVVQRTEGVSAAFIKELVRRSAQVAFGYHRFEKIDFEDVEEALQEMLFTGNQLNLSLLGATRDKQH